MKRFYTVFFLGVILLLIVLYTMFNTEVPKNVKQAFNLNFPEANKVKWEFEKGENLWEADFKLNDVKYSATFDFVGKLIEVEHEIQIEELPDRIFNKIKNVYSASEIKELEHVVKNDKIFYEIDLIYRKKRLELLYDSNGYLISEL